MRIGEYQLSSPLINGGGTVKSFEDTERMAATRVGAVMAGSFTLDERVGNGSNGGVVYHHDQRTGITYASIGLKNRGLRTVARSGELRRMIDVTHDQGKPFILNFAPVGDDPVGEIIDASEELVNANIQDLDAFELNASCPNVVTGDGGRHELLSYHPDLMGEVLEELSDISANEVPFGLLIVRISPFRQREDSFGFATAVKKSSAGAIAAFNAFPGGRPVDERGINILQVPGGVGGQSGIGMAQEAEEQTTWLLEGREAADAQFNIIASNGIGDALTMKRRIRMDLGISAVSASTIFWESSDWGQTVSKLLDEYDELGDV